MAVLVVVCTIPRQSGFTSRKVQRFFVWGRRGAISNGLQPAISKRIVSQPTTFTSSAAPGSAYDIAVAFTSLVPGLLVAPGARVNLNLGGPYFLVNGAFLPHPGTFSLMFASPPEGTTTSAQAIVIDPTNPIGFVLSQGAEVDSVPPSSLNQIDGPATDDSFIKVPVSSLPGITSIPFYNAFYTSLFVSSNGVVSFGAGVSSFAGTAAQALTGPPMVGAWHDLNPGVDGAVTIGLSGLGRVRVDWLGVPTFGQNTTENNHGIQIDAFTGTINIEGIDSIAASGVPLFLGISNGNLGATNAGATGFTPGGSGAAGSPTAMIYEAGPAGTLASGVTNIAFVPDGLGNYIWSAEGSPGTTVAFETNAAGTVQGMKSEILGLCDSAVPPPDAVMNSLILALDGASASLAASNGPAAIAGLNNFLAVLSANSGLLDAASPATPIAGITTSFSAAIGQTAASLVALGPVGILNPIVTLASKWTWIKRCFRNLAACLLACAASSVPTLKQSAKCAWDCKWSLLGGPGAYARCVAACLAKAYLANFVACSAACWAAWAACMALC